jgi:hypothetical protein
MRSLRTMSGVLVLVLLSVSDSAAQFGRAPARPPVSPSRPPMTPSRPPAATYRPPTTPGTPSSGQRVQGSGRAGVYGIAASGNYMHPSNVAVLVASTVGLLGSPSGHGPLLRAATLFPATAPSAPAGNANMAQSGGAQPLHQPPVNQDGGTWVVFLVMGVGILVTICVAIARSVRSSAVAVRVRIVALPPGEAPEQIRKAWVGLELPVAGRDRNTVVGVLSDRPAAGCDGYAVDGAKAVALLAARAPEAAAWWRRNAPHVLVGGYQLVFPAEICERVA